MLRGRNGAEREGGGGWYVDLLGACFIVCYVDSLFRSRMDSRFCELHSVFWISLYLVELDEIYRSVCRFKMGGAAHEDSLFLLFRGSTALAVSKYTPIFKR